MAPGFVLLAGRVNPQIIDSDWQATRRETDFVPILEDALKADKVEETLKSLLPVHAGYYYLRSALRRYRDIAARGAWPFIPDGPTMHTNPSSNTSSEKSSMTSSSLCASP